MNIEQALKLKINQPVKVPADRGDKGYTSKVKSVSDQVQTNYQGIKFVWVEVYHKTGNTASVWPSNRLTFN